MMHYKDYLGSIEFDEEGRLFYGKLEFIRALVSYEARDADSLVTAFHEAVDAYLAQCEAHGVKPEKPFKGSFPHLSKEGNPYPPVPEMVRASSASLSRSISRTRYSRSTCGALAAIN